MPVYRVINNTSSVVPLDGSLALSPGGDRRVAVLSRETLRLWKAGIVTVIQTPDSEAGFSSESVIEVDVESGYQLPTGKVPIGAPPAPAPAPGPSPSPAPAPADPLAAYTPSPDGSILEYQSTTIQWQTTLRPRHLTVDGGNF